MDRESGPLCFYDRASTDFAVGALDRSRGVPSQTAPGAQQSKSDSILVTFQREELVMSRE